MVILWVLATQYTPYARSITKVAKDQLSKGPNSRRYINTALHRAHEKWHQLHTSSVISLKEDLHSIRAMLDSSLRAYIIKKIGDAAITG